MELLTGKYHAQIPQATRRLYTSGTNHRTGQHSFVGNPDPGVPQVTPVQTGGKIDIICDVVYYVSMNAQEIDAANAEQYAAYKAKVTDQKRAGRVYERATSSQASNPSRGILLDEALIKTAGIRAQRDWEAVQKKAGQGAAFLAEHEDVLYDLAKQEMEAAGKPYVENNPPVNERNPSPDL